MARLPRIYIQGCSYHIVQRGNNRELLFLYRAGQRNVFNVSKRLSRIMHQRTGALWEGRFKSGVVETEKYLLTVYRYIELNPVRAGMVVHASEYP